MPEDRQAILAVILAVKRGFVSPEEGMKLLEQAEAEMASGPVDSSDSAPPAPSAEQTIYEQVPAEQREELRRDATILANDTIEAARILEEAGVPEEVQHTLLDLGSQKPEDVEATLLSLSPKRATTIIERPQVKPTAERYKLLREHARGGMGRIMVALDTTVGREVALKELLPGRGGSATGKSKSGSAPTDASMAAVARFMREATVTAQLEHPNIVPVYEIGTREDGSLYYTMKFVRGRTLATRLRSIRNDPDLNSAQKFAERLKLLDAFVDVCNAIAFSHSRGVIHRDIKPANIMLGDYGEALVLDWGLAGVREKEEITFANGTPVSDSQASDLTLEGEVMGTPSYMAPEQAAGKLNEVDERSDIYSLGAVLYEIVAGEAPYKGKSAKDVLSSVLSERPRQINILAPDAPPELAALVMRTLAREPDDRFQNARDLAEQVQAYRDGRMVSVYRYSATELLKRFVSKHRAAVTVSLLALLLLVAGSVYGYQRVLAERDSALAAEADALEQRGIAQLQATEAERQKKIAEDEAAEADRQEAIAVENAKEAKEQQAAAVRAAKKAADEEARANLEAEAAKVSAAIAKEKSDLAKRALEQAQRNLAEAHLGYAALARERNESGTELVHIAAAHKADSDMVTKPRLLGALNSRSFPLWRTRSYIDLPAGAATFSADRRLCAAPMHKPPQSIYEFNENATTDFADIGIWDVATGTLLRRIESAADSRRLIFDADAARLVAIESGGSLRMWNVATGEELVNRPAHAWGDSPQIVAAGEESFFTAVSDNKICEWLFADGSAGRVFDIPEFSLRYLAASPDGRYLAASDFNNGVRLWDLDSDGPPLKFDAEDMVMGLLFMPEGLLIVRNWRESELWNFTFTEMIRSYSGLSTWSVPSLELSPDGDAVLMGKGADGWKLVDAMTGETLANRGQGAGHVLAASLSSDGNTVVLALKGEGFDFVSADGKPLIERAPDHILGSLTLETSPDGQFYASGDFGGRLLLRRVLDGSTVWYNKVSSGNILRVAYSPDGSLIAVFGSEGVLSFVNAETGNITRYVQENLFGFGIKFSPDGEQVCAATRDGEILIINARTATVEKRMSLPHEGNVIGVEFDPNSDRVWLFDSQLSQWSWHWRESAPPTKDGVFTFSGQTNVYGMSGSPDGKVLVLATQSGHVLGWEPSPFRVRFNQKIGPGPITICDFGTTSEYFVCGTGDGMLCFVNSRTGSVIHRQRANPSAVSGVAVTPDGRNIITSGSDGEFLGWYSPSFLHPNVEQIGITSGSELALSADGNLVAFAVDGSDVKLVDASSLEVHADFSTTPGFVIALAFSPDGSLLAAGTTEGQVLLWDVEASSLAGTVAVHDDPRDLAFDGEGRLVVCGQYYGVQIRDPATGDKIAHWRETSGYEQLVAFPTGKRALLLGFEIQPRIIDLATGETVAQVDRGAFYSQACAVSDDERLLAMVRDRGQIGIHAADTGERLRTLTVRGGYLRSMMFLPGAERLICVYDNRNAIMVDVATGEELDISWFAASYIKNAELSTDGNFALIAGSEGELERWPIRRELYRLDALAKLDVDTILAMTQLMSGLKLDNLKAIPLPRETGAVTWLTEDKQAPGFLRSEIPDWIPRFVGARVEAAKDFLNRHSDRRSESIVELAKRWQEQFEGYRFKEVLAPDLSTERVNIPPREKDAEGNYIGEPEGQVDMRAWLQDRRKEARRAQEEKIAGYRVRAEAALNADNWTAAKHLYRCLQSMQPTNVAWALGYAESCMNVNEMFEVIDALEPFEISAPADVRARLHMLWARSLSVGYDYDAMISRFELARKAGYNNPDWHVHRVRAMEDFGAYNEAVAATQMALVEVQDPVVRAELMQLNARCLVWAQRQKDRAGFPALLVAAVPPGSRAETAGLQAGDEILSFRVEGSDHLGGTVMNGDVFRALWRRYLATSDEQHDSAEFTVIRDGKELQVNLARGKLDFETFTLRQGR